MNLFSRKLVLILNDKEVPGLRATFKVEKSDSQHPNTLELAVYNMSPEHRAELHSTKGIKVLLEAGYQNDTAVIFAGDARRGYSAQEGTDWVTKILCGDGEKAYRYAHYSGTFRPGTSVATVIRAVATSLGGDLGVSLGNLNEKLGAVSGRLTEFSKGITIHGRASLELTKLLRTLGLQWSIQEGQLQILGANESTRNQAVLLSPETGLVGSPEHGKPEKKGQPAPFKIKSLLQGRIRPGSKVQVRSQAYRDLVYRVAKVQHVGDTAGGDWYSNLEALPA